MPFNPYIKRREILVIGVEATRGTAATKPYAFRWLDKGISFKPSILENESAMGTNTRVNDSALDVGHSEGPIGGKVTEDNVAYLLHGMFSKVTTVDNEDGTYTHTFERDPSTNRKSLSIWDVLPSGARLYKSCFLDNINFSIEVGDAGAWFECSTAVKGWKPEKLETFAPPAFIAGEKEFTSRMVEIRLADDEAGLATGKIRPRSITFDLEETVTPDHYIGEVDNDPEFTSAPQEAKGSFVATYNTDEYEDDYFDNKVHAMSITSTNGGSKIEIIGTKVRFRELTNSDGRDDKVTQTVSYFFEADENNGGKDVTIKVTNKVAAFF